MKKNVDVTLTVAVEVDETKFDETFMREYRESFYPFMSIDDHIKHIAQMEARGILREFTEGYGPLDEMGIKAEIVDQDEEIVRT